MKDFIKRLSSRKFLLTVGTACILVANQQWTELVVLISGYVGVEGLGDASARYQAEKTKQNQVDQTTAMLEAGLVPDDVDKSSITPGGESTDPLPLE